MKRINHYILIITLMLPVMWGCGGNKKSDLNGGKTPADSVAMTAPALPLDDERGAALLRDVTALCRPWQQVRVPVSVKVNSPKSLSISGTAEMVRGKSVFMALKFLGMEVAWLYVSNDRLIVTEKMNKRYVSESPAQFLGGFDVNTANLQDLLIGRPFVLGTDDISAVRPDRLVFTAYGSGAWSMQPQSAVESMEYGFWFEPATVLNAAVVQYAGKSPVVMLYGTPVTTECGPLASHISIQANVGGTVIDATIFWNWTKAKWGDTFTPRDPRVPDSYRQVSAASVLKSLSHI